MPSATYTLTYDSTNDLPGGIYFQAVARENHDVYFTRVKLENETTQP
jgi:hypothetical protein